ncbi:MAG: SMP-30/gluconolactonase/LRE family protein [Candidatus Nanopelagicales bacterium]
MGDIDVDVVIDAGAEHAEGPIWDGSTSKLWWVDITDCRVHCFDPVTCSDDSWVVDGQPGGVLLGIHGRPVVAMPDGLAVLDTVNGSMQMQVPIESHLPGNRLNDLVADNQGRVWVGSMAYDRTPDAGSLYRVFGTEVERVVAPLTISNGPAIDEHAGRMYVADTARMTVDVMDFDVTTGELGSARRFVDLAEEGLWPDGMSIDDEGGLWLALGKASAVWRYRPDGVVDAVVELPVTNPTSVAFGGVDGGDLYITTSRFDITPQQRMEQPLAGAVFRCRPGISGSASPRIGVNEEM